MDPAALALYAGFDAIVDFQRGLIRRDQALAVGFSESTVDSLVTRRRWARLLPRVYLVGDGSPDDSEIRVRAGWLWAGEDSAVTGAAAAWWWGLTPADPDDVELVIPLRRRLSRWPGYRLIRADLFAREITEHRRLVVTTPAATCLRLARASRDDLLETALRGGVRATDLTGALVLGRGRRGQREATRRAAEVADNPWSAPERALHKLFRAAGITGWTANTPLRIGNELYYPDITFPRLRLLVEVDGLAHHSGREQLDADHRRQNALVGAGWHVLRFTARQIADEPEMVMRTVLAMIAWLSARAS